MGGDLAFAVAVCVLRGFKKNSLFASYFNRDRSDSHTQFGNFVTQGNDDLGEHVYVSPAGLTADFLRFGIRRSAQVPM